jgi:hypothetical protein
MSGSRGVNAKRPIPIATARPISPVQTAAPAVTDTETGEVVDGMADLRSDKSGKIIRDERKTTFPETHLESDAQDSTLVYNSRIMNN